MEVTLVHEAHSAKVVVRVAGKATIRSAGELKAVFLEAFDSAGEVVLDVSMVTEADAAFLQLLCAAAKSAVASGQRLSHAGEPSAAVAIGIDEAGFSRALGGAGEDRAILSGHGGDTR